MVTDVLTLLGGGLMLYLGAEWLVGGASTLALEMRIPKLLVGLTVVAYGTSAPEVIVGIQASHAGHGDVALGNVIGSNIANLGLILGVSMLVKPAKVDRTLRRRELPALLFSAAMLPLLLADGRVQWWEGASLLAGAIIYTAAMLRGARKKSRLTDAEESAEATAEAAEAAGAPVKRGGKLRHGLMALLGLVVLLVGGHVFVGSASELARAWGMSERVVGLTIVAIGTSLPELATSIIAALKGHSDIAIGNVVGSNIFNVLLCLGAASLVGNIGAPLSSLKIDIGTMALMTIAAAIFFRTERLVRRWEGAVLLVMYLAFLGYLIAA